MVKMGKETQRLLNAIRYSRYMLELGIGRGQIKGISYQFYLEVPEISCRS